MLQQVIPLQPRYIIRPRPLPNVIPYDIQHLCPRQIGRIRDFRVELDISLQHQIVHLVQSQRACDFLMSDRPRSTTHGKMVRPYPVPTGDNYQ